MKIPRKSIAGRRYSQPLKFRLFIGASL